MNKLEEVYAKIEELIGDKEPTSDVILEACVTYFRKNIYFNYPASEPKVVEALLLMYRYQVEQICEVIDNNKEDPFESVAHPLLEEMTRFSTALQKTFRVLSGQ